MCWGIYRMRLHSFLPAFPVRRLPVLSFVFSRFFAHLPGADFLSAVTAYFCKSRLHTDAGSSNFYKA
jgi:hypothetical protein